MLKRVSSALAKFVSPIASSRPLQVEESDPITTDFKKFDQEAIPGLKRKDSKEQKSDQKKSSHPEDQASEGDETQGEGESGLESELQNETLDAMVANNRKLSLGENDSNENPSVARAFLQMVNQIRGASSSVNRFMGKSSYKNANSKGSSKARFPKGTIYDKDIE